MKSIFNMILISLAVVAWAWADPPTVSASPVSAPVLFGVKSTEMPADMRAEIGEALPANAGLCVTSVTRKSPAEAAGIRPVDVILSVNGRPIATRADLLFALQGLKAGDEIPVQVLRDGQRKNLSLTLAGREALVAEPRPVAQRSETQMQELEALQLQVAYQLAQQEADVARIRALLARIKVLAGGNTASSDMRLSFGDAQGMILLVATKDALCVQIPAMKSEHVLSAGERLPAALRYRFSQIKH